MWILPCCSSTESTFPQCIAGAKLCPYSYALGHYTPLTVTGVSSCCKRLLALIVACLLVGLEVCTKRHVRQSDSCAFSRGNCTSSSSKALGTTNQPHTALGFVQ
jgi:hypothetical protein